MLQPIQTAQERALTSARRTNDGDDLAAMYVDTDITQHIERAEVLLQVRDADEG